MQQNRAPFNKDFVKKIFHELELLYIVFLKTQNELSIVLNFVKILACISKYHVVTLWSSFQ